MIHIHDERLRRLFMELDLAEEAGIPAMVIESRKPMPEVRLHVEPRKPKPWSKKAKRGKR